MRNKKILIISLLLMISILIPGLYNNSLRLPMDNFNSIKTSLDDEYDELWNNDTFENASYLDPDHFYSPLNCSDHDWYYTWVPAYHTIVVEIAFDNASGDLYLELYNSGGMLLNGSHSQNDYERVSYFTTIDDDFYFLVYFENFPNEYYYLSIDLVFEDPTMQLTEPIGSTIWKKDSYNWINWTTTGDISQVEIRIYKFECYVDYDMDDEYIKEEENEVYNTYISNTGSYEFWVPNYWSSGNYYVRIRDAYGYAEDISNIFAIIYDGEISDINFYSPRTNDILRQKSDYVIEWDWTGAITRVNIELWNGSSEKIFDIGKDIKNCGKFMWLVPITIPAGDTYSIRIYDSKNTATYDRVYPITIEQAMQIPGYPVLIVLGFSLIAIVSLIYYHSRRKNRII